MPEETNSRISIRAGFALDFDVCPETIIQAKRIIGVNISNKFGGCSVMQGVGYWSKNGDDFKNQYGALIEEVLLWVNLMIMPDQLTTARECLKECGVILKEMKLAPDIYRIHCEVSRSIADHITVDIPSQKTQTIADTGMNIALSSFESKTSTFSK